MTKLEFFMTAVSIAAALYVLLYAAPHMIEIDRRRFYRRN